MTRTAGKLGRLPAVIPDGLRGLKAYCTTPLPSPPAEVAVPAWPVWGMDGNDQYGDCGVAGLDHLFKSDASTTAEKQLTWPTDQEIVDYYLSYTGGQDDGVVLSDFLAYVRQHGFPGNHHVDSYAPVSVKDHRSLMQAIWLFDAAYLGITVTEAMQVAFETGQPWDNSVLASPVAGGHCVTGVAYSTDALTVVTWGGLQEITWPCWNAIASEAWAVLTGELVARHGDGRGVSLTMLRHDLNHLAA